GRHVPGSSNATEHDPEPLARVGAKVGTDFPARGDVPVTTPFKIKFPPRRYPSETNSMIAKSFTSGSHGPHEEELTQESPFAEQGFDRGNAGPEPCSSR